MTKVLQERNGDNEFFKTLSEAPPDIIWQQFENHSINSLVESFENRLQQQI